MPKNKIYTTQDKNTKIYYQERLKNVRERANRSLGLRNKHIRLEEESKKSCKNKDERNKRLKEKHHKDQHRLFNKAKELEKQAKEKGFGVL